jgi:2-keto-3-deoxy-6-phosphogluconate aldolase
MSSRTYEITFTGEAIPAIVDAFEDFEVTVGTGCTTLRAEQLDQAALHGAIDRLQALGLELLEVRVV